MTPYYDEVNNAFVGDIFDIPTTASDFSLTMDQFTKDMKQVNIIVDQMEMDEYVAAYICKMYEIGVREMKEGIRIIWNCPIDDRQLLVATVIDSIPKSFILAHCPARHGHFSTPYLRLR